MLYFSVGVGTFHLYLFMTSATLLPNLCLDVVQTFLNGPTPASLCLFLFLSLTIYRKIVDFGGIRTPIVGIEGEHLMPLRPRYCQTFATSVEEEFNLKRDK